MPFIDPPPCEFITVAEFISALHLLRGLQHTLVTGSQLSSSPFTDTPKRVIEARLDNDLSKRMSSNKELTEKRSSAVENDRECIVCMDDTTQVVLPCTHGFCAKCSETWFNHHRDCPVCRGEVSARNCTQEEWQVSGNKV